jgi:hypothetical protein
MPATDEKIDMFDEDVDNGEEEPEDEDFDPTELRALQDAVKAAKLPADAEAG